MKLKVSNVKLPLDAGLPGKTGVAALRRAVSHAVGLNPEDVASIELMRRSVDARKKRDVHFTATVAIEVASGSEGRVRPSRGVRVEPWKPYPQLEVPFVGDLIGEGGCAASEPGGAAVRGALEARLGDGAARPASFAAASATPGSPARSKTPAARSGSPRSCGRIVVAGMGPAGLFCALYLAEAGLRPLVVERGADVDARLAAVDAFDAGGSLDVQTNIQFGEGGAGTFSDGKLTTGTKSPHVRHVLQAFADAGAPQEILWQAKPHIGTDKLPQVVRTLRERIEEAGGEVRFLTRLADVRLRGGAVAEVVLEAASADAPETVPVRALVLACGHSARDVFELVRDRGLALERKPFSMGARIEHLQSAIDQAQYGAAAGHPALGAADYKLAVHVPVREGSPAREAARSGRGIEGCAAARGTLAPSDSPDSPRVARAGAGPQRTRGVYTFCMCPGGTVVAAASEEGGVVVNGMSRFARDGRNANSALLADVRPEDLPGDDVLEGVRLQREVERAAFRLAQRAGGASYAAPAQTVGDFLAHRTGGPSRTVEPTYPRGVVWCDLHECLPSFVTDAMEAGLPLLDRKLHGFADPEAVLTGPETRSSSPIRMLRGKNLQARLAHAVDGEADGARTGAVHESAPVVVSASASGAAAAFDVDSASRGAGVDAPARLSDDPCTGIYPCGEGAGYAGGIMSAACDGLRVAEAIVREIKIAEARIN